jgi:hypothetical protein
MKTSRAFIIIALFTLTLLAAGQPALAQRGYETGGGTAFDRWVDKHAHGKKFNGTLAMHYEKVCEWSPGSECCSFDDSIGTRMFFVVRIETKKDLYVFSGSAGTGTDPLVCYLDLERQKQVLFDFMGTVVLPEISPGSTTFALKKVDNVVDTHDSTFAEFFTMMDVVLVVQD